MRAARPLILLLALTTVMISGCAPDGSQSERLAASGSDFYPQAPTYPGVRMIEDLSYGAESSDVLLDVCLPDLDAPATAAGTDEPETSQPRAVVLSVHGGSWRQGDKSDAHWQQVCKWLASEGFVALSANYRLAPANPFPAAMDDLRQVVQWIRDDRQVRRFDIDPDRIGAFGGSAGGNLVALLGLEGTGDLTTGSRVAAVVDLSGPVDLTQDGFALGGVVPEFQTTQLQYIGCDEYTACAQARAASPLYSVDETDPAFFIAHSTGERIPIQQSAALVAALREAGVDTTYVTVEGTLHSIAMLDGPMRERIGEWLRAKLAP